MRSLGTLYDGEGRQKTLPDDDFPCTFEGRACSAHFGTKYSTIPSNTNCSALGRRTVSRGPPHATRLCRGCPRPSAPRHRNPALCCVGTSRVGGHGGGRGTWSDSPPSLTLAWESPTRGRCTQKPVFVHLYHGLLVGHAAVGQLQVVTGQTFVQRIRGRERFINNLKKFSSYLRFY